MGINYKRAYGDQPDYKPNKALEKDKVDKEANESTVLNKPSDSRKPSANDHINNPWGG